MKETCTKNNRISDLWGTAWRHFSQIDKHKRKCRMSFNCAIFLCNSLIAPAWGIRATSCLSDPTQYSWSSSGWKYAFSFTDFLWIQLIFCIMRTMLLPVYRAVKWWKKKSVLCFIICVMHKKQDFFWQTDFLIKLVAW